jgi:ribosomal protein S12 methylthiotransferase accessory factor
VDTGEAVWVPALPTYFNYQVPANERFCQVSSNGLAAGASFEDAAIRAICELVERDAFMLTWLTRRAATPIEIDEHLPMDVREIVRQLRGMGVDPRIFLLQSDIAIPVALCIGYGDGKSWPGATVSLGCHFDPAIAVRKAVFEQAHVGPYIRRLYVDEKRKVAASPEDVKTLEDHALFYAPKERASALGFLAGGPAKSLGEMAFGHSSRDRCSELAKTAGVRLAVVDLTSPDTRTGPFRVVRALGDGIQQIDFGYRVRRLGNPRLRRHLGLGELNPMPHPLA